MIYYAKADGEEKKVKIEKKDDLFHVTVDHRCYEVDIRRLEGLNAMSIIIDSRCYEASITNSDKNLLVCISGEKFEITLKDELEYLTAPTASHHAGMETDEITAPMPGIVVAIEVKEGQEVHPGSAVIIIEAMKMQNEISALAGGKVNQILVKEGDVVESRQTLIVLDRQ